MRLQTTSFLALPPFAAAAAVFNPPMSFSTPRATAVSSRSPAREARGGPITAEEWRGWGTGSVLVPEMVGKAVEYLRDLEEEKGERLRFGGNGGKIVGNFKVQEDKKHRAAYKGLSDSEEKLQFFSARQIACRLLGSRGYLCQKCWLAMDDCMCSEIKPSSLWNGIRLWVYMHPKDFLRQNNTGKLLWQVFGVQSASLSLFGIAELEEIMWHEFKNAGKSKVWCLYPSKGAVSKSVEECFSDVSSPSENHRVGQNETLHFILIDGTWSNSNAMVSRLKDHVKLVWGDVELPCISLAAGASSMHRLRPQPSWDRTCTAAAAADLLSELHLLPNFSSYGLAKQAEAVDDALEVLLDALTGRRLRNGRSITREVRNTSSFS